MTCTEISYILDFSVNIFSVTCALTKVFNVKSEKYIIVLKINATTLKFEERLDYGNGKCYMLAEGIYANPNYNGETHLEGKKSKGKIPTKPLGMIATISNTAINHNMKGDMGVNEN